LREGRDLPRPLPLPLMTLSFLPVLALSLSPLQETSRPQVSALIPLLHAADANRDAEVSPEEWAEFVGSLGFGPELDAPGDRELAAARMLLPYFDLDDDGVFTGADLDRVFAGLDRDGDGAIAGEERPAGQRPSEGGPSANELFLGGFSCLAADVDGDQRITAAEWSALRSRCGTKSEPVPMAELRTWMEIARADDGEADRNAVSAGVALLTWDGQLDADRNGRFDRNDLALHREALDPNGDGTLSVEEVRQARRSSRAQRRFEVSEEMTRRAPLMPWQRNLDDALALVERTGKPLLICVNMDGESASEELAFGRYRDPAFVELASGFVPLIVSPDRRNPLDHDDQGRRIEDPRFGRIVTGEAIALDPVLYDRYFGERRVAPRHIGVSPEGEILFDVYLVDDLTVIDDALRQHGSFDEAAQPLARTEEELLASPDAGDRRVLEQRFLDGAERDRVRLAGLSLSRVRPTQHPEVLRMALRDASPEVRRQALWTVAQNVERTPSDLLARALNLAADEPVETAALLAAVSRLEAPTDAAGPAVRLARVFRTLHASSELVQANRWKTALRLAEGSGIRPLTDEDFDLLTGLLEELDVEQREQGAGPELWLQVAAANMRLAQIQIARGRNPLYFLSDAATAAESALALAPDDARALGYLSWSSYLQADLDTAGAYAERALPGLLPLASTELAGRVLDVFAQTRVRDLYGALGEGRAWPAAWVPDIRAAFESLLLHPIAEERHSRAYLDFLGTSEAYALQEEWVRKALEERPDSSSLHAYLRNQVLRDEGAAELARVYDEEIVPQASADSRAAALWYAGVARLVSAEHQHRTGDRESALESYRTANEILARSSEERQEFTDSANHYRCLALAGASRVYREEGRFAEAVASLVEGIQARPASSQSSDGLGETPLQLARELGIRLERAEEAELARVLARCLEENGLEAGEGA